MWDRIQLYFQFSIDHMSFFLRICEVGAPISSVPVHPRDVLAAAQITGAPATGGYFELLLESLFAATCNCSQTESEQEILILYCRSHALCLSRSPRRRDPVHQPLGRQYFSGPPQRSQLHWQTRNRMQYSTLEEGINEASCFPAGSSPVQSRLLVPPAVRNPIRPAAINQGRL